MERRCLLLDFAGVGGSRPGSDARVCDGDFCRAGGGVVLSAVCVDVQG